MGGQSRERMFGRRTFFPLFATFSFALPFDKDRQEPHRDRRGYRDRERELKLFQLLEELHRGLPLFN